MVIHFDVFGEIGSIVNPSFGPLGVILAFFATNRSRLNDKLVPPFAISVLALTLVWMLIVDGATTGFVWTTYRDLNSVTGGPMITKDVLDTFVSALSKFQAVIVAAIALAFGSDASESKANG